MIIDIDSQASVHENMMLISDGWFNPQEMYADLKSNGKTNSAEFWGYTNQILIDAAGFLGLTLLQFQTAWDRKCIDSGIKIMGYHCTRHSDRSAFTAKGILPFSEETIEIAENQSPASRQMLEIRSKRPGPCFHVSYKWAKNSNAHAFFNGPEILLGCAGRHVGVEPGQAVPFLLHCAIPYSIVPKPRDCLAIYILSAYFNFIDPLDDSTLSFDGCSIDLSGNSLDPCHIVKIEEM